MNHTYTPNPSFPRMRESRKYLCQDWIPAFAGMTVD
jgi:hypothetical protein